MDATSAALRELIDSHYQSLYRYAYRLSGSQADAEDLTQEAFQKAFSQSEQLRDPARARFWLFRILRNTYLHQVRDRKRKGAIPLDSVGDLPQESGEEQWPIQQESLQAALDELDETFRTPLILFYFEEFSYKDIAEQMELPIGTVMSRLARAKAYLKQRLSPEYDTTTEAPAWGYRDGL